MKNSKYLFSEGIRFANLSLIKEALSIKDLSNYDINEAYLKMCRNGHSKMIKLLIEDGRFDPTYQNNKGIKLASRNRNNKAIHLLWSISSVKIEIKNNLPKIYEIMKKNDLQKNIKHFE